ncbi:hypothetical protein B0H34DRAFT_747330 [Crassisporium funariophilum]|nr:hypothetical protein B0H34DRAFT_747330 [Crassisporium funariophilum]
MLLSGTSSVLFSLLGWTFIPDLATTHILRFLYHSSPRFLRLPAPTPSNTHQQRTHRALTFALVICAYLLYTLVSSARAMPPNLYAVLGVAPDVDEAGLKGAFRAFARVYHPDRPGVGREGEVLFMQVRDAFEALKDPVVRFAYDRFGGDVLLWRQQCKTTREFLRQGLMVSSGYHIVAGIALLFWSAIGAPTPVSFVRRPSISPSPIKSSLQWRYVLFFALLAAELSFILSPFPNSPSLSLPNTTRAQSFLASILAPLPLTPALRSLTTPHPRSFLQWAFPSRAPYQHILFLHQIFMFLSVALSRVVPQFAFLLADPETSEDRVDPETRAVWERVYATARIADREASIMLHTILASFSAPAPSPDAPYHVPTLARPAPLTRAHTEKALERLTPEMEALVVEANIKNQVGGPIRGAWEAALAKMAFGSPVKASHAGVEKEKESDNDRPRTPTPASMPMTPRSKNFWERAAGEEEVAVPVLQRTPSTPRLGGCRLFGGGVSGLLGAVIFESGVFYGHNVISSVCFQCCTRALNYHLSKLTVTSDRQYIILTLPPGPPRQMGQFQISRQWLPRSS